MLFSVCCSRMISVIGAEWMFLSRVLDVAIVRYRNDLRNFGPRRIRKSTISTYIDIIIIFYNNRIQ